MPRIVAVYSRAVRLAVVLVAVLVLAGCGAMGDGPEAALEESVADAVRARLDADAPLSELRAVECRRDAATCRVDVDLGVERSVLRIDYALAIGADGCWTADPVRVEQLGAGAGVEPELDEVDARLEGCGA